MEIPLQPELILKTSQGGRLGKKIHYFSELDSTNLFAVKRAQEGGEEGEIVVAERQTHGKGRMGRSWFSPPGLNLYLSAILRPRLHPLRAPQITLMAAVALAETAQTFLPDPVAIKWPNDILVKGMKLAGILTESSCDSERIHYVILGIGVNLNLPLDLLPDALRDRATSLLTLTGKPIDRTAFACRLIRSLDQCYGELEGQGFGRLAERWDRFFALKGKRVRVDMAGEAVSGRAAGIDKDGALILQLDDGSRRRILAGDVIPLEA